MNLSPMIEHTLLKADARISDIQKHCAEALEHQFFGVCVNSCYVALARSLLKDNCKVISVVGFPLGSVSSKAKAAEAADAVASGADEIDMVIHLGALKEGRRDDVIEDIRSVIKAAPGKPVKVIIETGVLSPDEKKLACELVRASGAHFIKTCTGFAPGNAEVLDIELMRSIVAPQVGIKASGGVRTREQAIALIEAGATRLGTSSGVQLIAGQISLGTY